MTKYKNAWAVAPFFMFALHGGAIFETFNLFHLAYSFLFPRFEAVSLSHEIRVSASALLSLVGASIIVSMIVGTGINNLKGSSFAWTVFAIIVSYVSYNMLPDETNHVTDLLTFSVKTNSIGKFMFAFLLPYSVYFSTHQVAKRTTKTDFESKELALEERKRLNTIREQELEQEKYEAALRNKAHQEQLKSVKRYFIPEQTEKQDNPTLPQDNPTINTGQDQYSQVFEKFGLNGTPRPHLNGTQIRDRFEARKDNPAKNKIGFSFGQGNPTFGQGNPTTIEKEVVRYIGKGYPVDCLNCGTHTIRKSSKAKFCSDACCSAYHKREGGKQS